MGKFEDEQKVLFQEALKMFMLSKDKDARKAAKNSELEIEIRNVYEMGEIRHFPFLKLFTTDVDFKASTQNEAYFNLCKAMVAVDRDDHRKLYVRKITNLRYFAIS